MNPTPVSTLDDPQQIIADLQRQLAESNAERDEAQAQKAAIAEILEVINSSPGDLAPVFDALLTKAMHLCDVAFGTLRLYDGERFHLGASQGASPALLDFQREPLQPGLGAARMLAGEDVVNVPDIIHGEAYRSGSAAQRALVELGGARSNLAVALRRGLTLLGYISVYRREVRPFTDKQIALLQNFAAQAVIAMENARLITETREALEQQTATAEVLGVINSSPGDLAPVFDAMLEKVTRLCEASFGIANTYDGDRFRTAALHGVPEPLAELWLSAAPPPPANGPLARIASGEDVVHIEDFATSPGYLAGEPRPRAMVELGGAHSYVAVALRKDGKLLGTLAAYRQEVRPFTDKQIGLLQNFAAQAVIAMENARLISETREALEQQTATAEVLQVINSSPGDLAPVFNAILEKAQTLCDAAYGSLMLRDGDRFRAVAVYSVSETFAERLREGFPLDNPFVKRLLDGDNFVHNPDMAEVDHPIARTAVELTGARTRLLVPLRKDDVLLGAICAIRREVRPFSDKQIALLQNFAAQAVIAMENARLLGELRQRTGDLQESLEYQTATSDVLKVISGSTFDIQPVFETIVETAARLCDADLGHLFRRDANSYHRVAAFGLSPEYRQWLESVVSEGRALVPNRGSIVGRVALEGRVVHVTDLASDSEYSQPESVTLGGLRTVVGVPLLREGEPIGVITLGRQRVEPFTERQIELVRTFADQAVIAIENARLLGELRQRTEEVAELNRGLEERVAEQVDELSRVGRLKRFLAPQLAELIVSHGDEKILESHRREIVVVFCDLRGYTAFTETAEPEEVLDFLREYHGALGPLVSQFEGTLDQFSGDGIMVFFNDPVPCADPAERAVKMAMAMREAAGDLIAAWRRRGRELGFGAGIAQGYATLGQIGFAERSGYTAIGTVCNVAARLCAEAKDGQILLSQRVAVAVEGTTTLEEHGALTLKGLTQPVVAYNVPLGAIQPALRVIEGGPQSV